MTTINLKSNQAWPDVFVQVQNVNFVSETPMETEIQNRLSPLTTEAVDEVLDPRIQVVNLKVLVSTLHVFNFIITPQTQIENCVYIYPLLPNL